MLTVALNSNGSLIPLQHEVLLECKDGMRSDLAVSKLTTQGLCRCSDVCPLPSSLGSVIVMDKQSCSSPVSSSFKKHRIKE